MIEGLRQKYRDSQDDHEDYADLTNEVPGTGNYTTGGATLANAAVTKDNTNNRGVFDADDVTWSNSTIANARYAIVYKDSGVDATSWLILAADFGANKSSTTADFTLRWHSDGIHYLG